jgi:glycosyltransferase 2 family protein
MLRRFLYALLLFLAIMFVVSRLAEFEQIVNTLRVGTWYWLALAVVVQAVYLVNMAAGYQAVFRAVGVEQKLKDLLPLVIAANFINVVTVSGGIAGMAIFVDEARRNNQSTARVTIGGVLFVLFDYAAFLCVLTVGFMILLRRHDLPVADVIAAAILVVVALSLGALLVLGLRSAQALEQALVRIVRLINGVARPLLHRDYLSEATAREFAVDAAEGFAEMRHRPRRFWLQPFALTLSAKALLISILFLVFLAFHQGHSVGILIAAFSLAYLFLIVSPTPSGIGIVEGVMPLVLSSFRIPLGAGVVITLAYRGLTFWLPFFYGFLALRWLVHRAPPLPAEQSGHGHSPAEDLAGD